MTFHLRRVKVLVTGIKCLLVIKARWFSRVKQEHVGVFNHRRKHNVNVQND